MSVDYAGFDTGFSSGFGYPEGFIPPPAGGKQMTPWEDIAQAVVTTLSNSLPDVQVTLIQGSDDYLSGNVGQAFNRRDYLVLVSRPEGNHYSTAPRMSWYFRRQYFFAITVVVKTDPTSMGRILGNAREGLTELQSRVEEALEHSNLSGKVDHKAGQNFESGWQILPVENKAYSASSTIYTAVKTER